MKKIVLFVFCFCFLMLLFQENSFACSCAVAAPLPSLRKQVSGARKESKAVFSGKVVEVNRNAQSQFITVKFKVENSWKGNITQEVSITTGLGSGDCGYSFEVGKSYLVYAYGSNENSLQTNICQRTGSLTDSSKDIKMLGKGTIKPLKKNND